jgi:hypothetical protein
MKSLGYVLLAIGAAMMLYTGFNIVTTKNVANLGPIHINKEENHPISWSPVVGGVLLAAGLVLVIADRKK